MKNIKIGIWLDYRAANIITLKGKGATYNTIASGIDDAKPRGGSRPKKAYGPVDTVSEKHFSERRKHEEKAYYENLITAVKDAHELYLFGPAEAKNGLLKAIKANKNFKPAFKGIETADSMTENQKIAKVRAFYAGINA